ncbi:AAA family ATPase, partial [Faecalitalea cylindroides]|uniref:AAA family ATPase n=1 Tax=Faecalitalea cylindroides TaxID=39483 RepID=UPI001E38868B
WEKCINSLRIELDCDIYITGSNANLLSSELATYLAGRYVEFVIYPFSFSEFIELYNTIHPGMTNQQLFNEYLMYGGMPYLANLNYNKEAVNRYLLDLFNSVELKDIVKRNRIRDIDILERILAFVTKNIGTTFSATSISKYLKNEGRSI